MSTNFPPRLTADTIAEPVLFVVSGTYRAAFNVRVEPGTEERPIVQFFDAEYAGRGGFTALGQFTGASYFVDTLREGRERRAGLELNGHVSKWHLDALAWLDVMAWLDEIVPAPAEAS